MFVFGLKTKELVCKFALKHKRFNPILYLHTIKGVNLLLIIGGFEVISNEAIDGCKIIEIFLLDKWSIGLKEKMIKLNIGRISPIIVTISDSLGNPMILIEGGNTTGSYKKKGFFGKILQ